MTVSFARPTDVAPLPVTGYMTEEALATYESYFGQHARTWTEILEENASRLARGEYSLHWMNTDKANW